MLKYPRHDASGYAPRDDVICHSEGAEDHERFIKGQIRELLEYGYMVETGNSKELLVPKGRACMGGNGVLVNIVPRYVVFLTIEAGDNVYHNDHEDTLHGTTKWSEV